MTETRKLRVFLCHTSQDKPIVRELYHRLNAEGWIDPWLDEEKLLPGQDWDMEIEKTVENSDVVIALISSKSVSKKGYVQKEIKIALNIALYNPEGIIFIIPLRLDECVVPWSIKSIQYIDYFPQEQIDISYNRLLDSLETQASLLGINTKEIKEQLLLELEEISRKEREEQIRKEAFEKIRREEDDILRKKAEEEARTNLVRKTHKEQEESDANEQANASVKNKLTRDALVSSTKFGLFVGSICGFLFLLIALFFHEFTLNGGFLLVYVFSYIGGTISGARFVQNTYQTVRQIKGVGTIGGIIAGSPIFIGCLVTIIFVGEIGYLPISIFSGFILFFSGLGGLLGGGHMADRIIN